MQGRITHAHASFRAAWKIGIWHRSTGANATRPSIAEFKDRKRISKPRRVIRSATTTAAELFQMTGEVGVVAVDAHGRI